MSLKQTTTIKQAAALLKGKSSVALFAHTNPDGDTVGATIALKLILQQLGATAAIHCDSDMSARLSTFEPVKQFSKTCNGKYDLLVAVDCGDIFRLGEFGRVYNSANETLTIDHHCGKYFSKYNCLYNYASTCQIIYEIANELNVTFDSELATYLYMGLCTDTGNFAHNNTDSASFYMAGNLFKYGAEIERVYRVFFRDTTFAETKLLARVISRMRSYYDGRMFLMYVTRADLDELGLDQSTTSGIVSYAIDIDTARVGVCICEFAPNSFKVSMRGKDFNVREVCNQFGGDGHISAAGCKINGFLEDVIEKIVRAVGFSI